MTLFEMSDEDRRQYVAALLGCKPTDRSGRLDEKIDQMLQAADRCARDKLAWDASRGLST